MQCVKKHFGVNKSSPKMNKNILHEKSLELSMSVEFCLKSSLNFF